MSLTVHIPVIVGAPEALVSKRELCGRYASKDGMSLRSEGYQVNRPIKIWAAYFQLKSITTSGQIKNWNAQKTFLLSFLQVNENTLRSRIKELQKLGLIEIDNGDIMLTSYKKAASLLGIEKYHGTYKIPFNPEHNNGKQTFQYLLRAEEIRNNQQMQLSVLMYYIDKNPTLKTDLIMLLVQTGSSRDKLDKDPAYFQAQLLALQADLFQAGSDLFGYVMTQRADINRSVTKIQEVHGYKAPQSVSYMKKIMAKIGLISITKKRIESAARIRHYIPAENGSRRQGYKWVSQRRPFSLKDDGYTLLVLTDQITINYQRK